MFLSVNICFFDSSDLEILGARSSAVSSYRTQEISSTIPDNYQQILVFINNLYNILTNYTQYCKILEIMLIKPIWKILWASKASTEWKTKYT